MNVDTGGEDGMQMMNSRYCNFVVFVADYFLLSLPLTVKNGCNRFKHIESKDIWQSDFK